MADQITSAESHAKMMLGTLPAAKNLEQVRDTLQAIERLRDEAEAERGFRFLPGESVDLDFAESIPDFTKDVPEFSVDGVWAYDDSRMLFCENRVWSICDRWDKPDTE